MGFQKLTYLGEEVMVQFTSLFDLQQLGSYKSFQVECEVMRRIHDHYLINIIMCCSSVDNEGQDFKAMVLNLCQMVS